MSTYRKTPGNRDVAIEDGTELRTITPLGEEFYDREETGPMYVVEPVGFDGVLHLFADEIEGLPSGFEVQQYLDSLPKRDTTLPGVKAVDDYTFDELITHLHDHHGYGAESQTDDEGSNHILDEAGLDVLANMTRDEAIARLPYHYFQNEDTPDSLESARSMHAQDHGDNYGGGAGGKRHFHPGQWRL